MRAPSGRYGRLPRCRVALAAAGALLCVWALAAPEAGAHGGQWKPPEPVPSRPGGSPPPFRKPEQPTLPVPTPTTPRPPTPPGVPPVTPGPAPPAPTPPTTPPTTPPPVTPPTGGWSAPGTGPTGRPRPASGQGAETDWLTWWLLNRWAFLPERRLDPERVAAVVTPSGAPAEDPTARLVAQRDAVAGRLAVPFLLDRLDPARREDAEVVSAALLALARLSRSAEHAAVLLDHALDPRRPALVRESAALAAGLLRRSDPARAFDGLLLDTVRRDLLRLCDEADAPTRTRAFAVLAVGLLGDQPFGASFSAHGRLVVHELGRRLAAPHADAEITVALLTALGLQPLAGVPESLQADLRRIVLGKRVYRRGWDAYERSHALTALCRLRAPGWQTLVLRVLGDRRSPAPGVRAALLALGAQAGGLTPTEREEAVVALLAALDKARDPATRGLTYLALGRVVREDLHADSMRGLDRLEGGKALVGYARNAPAACRGFAILALGLVLGPAAAHPDGAARAFAQEGRKELLFHLARDGNPDARAACVVALGLTARREDVQSPLWVALRERFEDRNEDPGLRAHAGLGLALGADGPEEVAALLAAAVGDPAHPDVQAEAAFALSFLGGRPETRALLAGLDKARSQNALAKVVTALGRLGDPLAAQALVAVARDRARGDEPRALAVAALGLLLDPEPRPSLMRLSVDANYPARTEALQEAFTIF